MKIGIIPEHALERVARASGLVPRPMFDTQVAMRLSRTIMAATTLGVFEALGPARSRRRRSRSTVAPTHVRLRNLLIALAGSGYVRTDHGQYALTPVARTWLLKDSPRSLRDKMLGQFTEWEWIAGYEAFVASGTPSIPTRIMSETSEGAAPFAMGRAIQRSWSCASCPIGTSRSIPLRLQYGSNSRCGAGGSVHYASNKQGE